MSEFTLRQCYLFIALAACSVGAAYPDTFAVTYLNPGVQTPAGITTHYEDFNSQTPGGTLGSPFVTNFSGSGFTGTYTGSLIWYGANAYGGAGGTGVYAQVVNGSSYSLSINPSANYFGLWFSALDHGNSLQFYSGSNLLYSFTPADFQALVGSCPTSAFCGNPNAAFLGQDGGEQFAYLNFYDSTATFNKVVFSEIGYSGGGFESDNQAVGMLTSAPGGTTIPTVPEPALLSVVGFAGLGVTWLLRRKLRN